MQRRRKGEEPRLSERPGMPLESRVKLNRGEWSL